MVGTVLSGPDERMGMNKKELLTVNELETEFRMRVKSIQGPIARRKSPYVGLVAPLAVAPGYIRSHLDTSD